MTAIMRYDDLTGRARSAADELIGLDFDWLEAARDFFASRPGLALFVVDENEAYVHETNHQFLVGGQLPVENLAAFIKFATGKPAPKWYLNGLYHWQETVYEISFGVVDGALGVYYTIPDSDLNENFWDLDELTHRRRQKAEEIALKCREAVKSIVKNDLRLLWSFCDRLNVAHWQGWIENGRFEVEACGCLASVSYEDHSVQ